MLALAPPNIEFLEFRCFLCHAQRVFFGEHWAIDFEGYNENDSENNIPQNT